MKTWKAHEYKGVEIYRCEVARSEEHGGRWMVQTYHGPTGMPYADELCPHFHTLAQCREHISEHLVVHVGKF